MVPAGLVFVPTCMHVCVLSAPWQASDTWLVRLVHSGSTRHFIWPFRSFRPNRPYLLRPFLISTFNFGLFLPVNWTKLQTKLHPRKRRWGDCQTRSCKHIYKTTGERAYTSPSITVISNVNVCLCRECVCPCVCVKVHVHLQHEHLSF